MPLAISVKRSNARMPPYSLAIYTEANGCHLSAQLPSKRSASAAVVVMGLVWAALGGSLLLATEYLQDTHAK